MRVFWACLILGLFGCAGETDVMRSHDNTGTLCIRSTANGPIVVRAVAPTCLSSSCSTVEQATCSIDVEGERIIVSSTFRVREKGGDVACTGDCRILSADCTSLSSLSAGEFTVQYGDATGTLVVPSSPSILFSDDGFGTFACE